MGENLILITGDDLEQIRSKTALAVTDAAGDAPDEFSLDVIKENDDSTPLEVIGELIKSVQTPSFFGRKTICLQGCSFFDREGNQKDKGPLAEQFRALGKIISEGVPQDVFLILSGASLDSRKGLYKACQKSGAQIHSFKKIQLGGKWQQEVSQMIRQEASLKQLNFQYDAIEYLTEVIGPEVGRIKPELEKIACACGGLPQISYRDICDICTGNASTAFWAFSNALGERKLKDSFRAIDRILTQDKDPEGAVIGLLLQTSKHFRLLLKLKIFMQQNKLTPGTIGNFLKNLSATQKAELKGTELARMHPYRAGILAKNCALYQGPELLEAIRLFTETNRKLVSSAVSRRMLLEQLSLAIIKGKQPSTTR